MTACVATRSALQVGVFDLLDPTSPVYLTPGWDRGAAQPTVSDIQSSVLDGAAVVGAGSANRQVVIPFNVRAADRATLAGLVNQVLLVVTQASWALTFTPAGGFAVVYDCYRATVTVTSPISQDENACAQSLQITCEALPFGRSLTPITVALTGSPKVVDAFDATPAPTVTATRGTAGPGAYVTTPTPAQGTKSLDVPFTVASKKAGDIYNYGTAFTLAKTGISITPTGTPWGNVKLYLRHDTGALSQGWSLALTITTNVGTYTGSASLTMSDSWQLVTVALNTPIGATETITGYTISMSASRLSGWSAGSTRGAANLYFDAMFVYPAASVGINDSQGSTLHLTVAGSARAPLALALSQVAGGAFSSWLVHSPPADRPTAQPLIPLGGGASGVSYTTDPSVDYGGTYSVWIFTGSTVANAGTPRVITITFAQGGVTQTFTGTIASMGANGKSYLGDIMLPLVNYPAESSAPLTITVTSAQSADTFNDVLLLDTRGQTVSLVGGNPKLYAWVDEPAPSAALGGIWQGTAADRSDALSVAGRLQAASVLFANPGDSSILICSPSGALQGTATYSPRWQHEATQ